MSGPRESSKPRQSFPRGPILACFMVLAGLAATEASAPGRFDGDAGTAALELDAGTEEPARVDTHREGDLSVKAGPAVPLQPESWQKRPPCDWEGAREVALRGACYVRSGDAKPPCPGRLFESGDSCYVAVTRAPRPNTTIEE